MTDPQTDPCTELSTRTRTLLEGKNDPEHDPVADEERTGPYVYDDPDDPEIGHGH